MFLVLMQNVNKKWLPLYTNTRDLADQLASKLIDTADYIDYNIAGLATSFKKPAGVSIMSQHKIDNLVSIKFPFDDEIEDITEGVKLKRIERIVRTAEEAACHPEQPGASIYAKAVRDIRTILNGDAVVPPTDITERLSLEPVTKHNETFNLLHLDGVVIPGQCSIHVKTRPYSLLEEEGTVKDVTVVFEVKEYMGE